MLKTCLRIAAAIAASAVFLWIAGPALSTDRYMPGAVDFEQPLPELQPVATATAARVEAGADHGEGPVLFRSAPIDAPKRFDLVGIGGEMGNYEVRVRSGDDPWSEWVELGDGSPLYTGGSDAVQVRSRSSEPPEGRLHYVNVSGDSTAAGGILNDLRGTINSALISVVGTADAVAASPKPEFIQRSDWGADAARGGCEPRVKPEYGKVKAVAVHHTVSVNDYSESEVPGIVLGICRYHRNGNGWNDIGYNALVDRFGNVYEGRAGGMAKPVVGAQSEGYNAQTAGIATIANHEQIKPSTAEKHGLIEYLAWRLDKAGVPALGRTTLKSAGGDTTIAPAGHKVRVGHILGHRDLDSTECPGTHLYDKLPAIKRSTQGRIDTYAGSSGGGGGSGDGGGGTGPRG